MTSSTLTKTSFTSPTLPLEASEETTNKLVLWHMIVAFVSLLLGGIAGLLQSFVRSGAIELPANISYYQVLTLHGVLMALVFTTFFISGFLLKGVAHELGGGALYRGPATLAWTGFILMTLGTTSAAVPMLLNEASVLYTFYAPMKAAPAFYIGLALVVVGSWLIGFAIFRQYAAWRRYHPRGRTMRSPLFSFMAVATFLVWQIATLGVAVEVLVQLIPWSFGWVDTVNVLLSRTLFWFFGHPLVYFWLMPAYMAWYVCLPHIIGGKIFSDALARLAFLLLVMFSVPVGLHHQFTEPGVSTMWKLIHTGLTMAVAFPSLITAFSMFAMLELAARKRGGSGILKWWKYLPWSDARFLAPMLAMFIFAFGGAGGMILASAQLNQIAHNTLFITGHFHLTVATASALTFFGVAFWLVPHVAGRKYTPGMNRLALAQVWLWGIGMTIMSTAQHIVGLFGAPRRTSYSTLAGDNVTGWDGYIATAAVGGTILFVSVLMVVYIVFHLAFRAPRGRTDFQLTHATTTVSETPSILERWRIWLVGAVFLIIVAYAIPLYDQLQHTNGLPGSPPFKPY